ncbi:alpha/beta hydrolase [Pseudonocardia sp. MH-G8]|uniref:alpha/beta hydrolase n=1 Tax=Pseudonocardia sp. MH-G8 TaxID=1854588 RepID=UPI000BA16A7B|nr:alpha/beta hydrolase [Pseudonocardia sp. MH-G8]OZM79854.1 alpha/beta hydrolase [Pseudonocardia sp. MH-G8]
MAAPPLVLVHSPLVGPSTWQAVASEFRSRGRTVCVPSLVGAVDDGPPFYQGFAERVHACMPVERAGGVVLAVHSGAGPLVPSVLQAAPVEIGAVVFVDATLPHPGRAWFDSVPTEMAGELRSLASGGILPPWQEWFEPAVLRELLPDAGSRAAFVAEVPRLPVDYFAEVAPNVPRWEGTRAGYLRLSEPYEGAAEEAARRGWPVRRYRGRHLSPVVEPAEVADAIDELLDLMENGEGG